MRAAVLMAVFGALVGVAQSARADVIEVPEIIIHAVPQRPNAFYVIERSVARMEVRDLRESFTDEIVRDAAHLTTDAEP